MFAYLTPEEQVRKLQQENRALKEHVRVLEDAIVELAEIVATTEEEVTQWLKSITAESWQEK